MKGRDRSMGDRPLISMTRWIALAIVALALAAPSAATAVGAPPADVGVNVIASDTVTAGEDLEYPITVTNAGPNAADVTLTNPLPAGTTFKSLDSDAGFTCTTPAAGAAGTISCSKASLAAGGNATFLLTVHVPASTADQTTLSDTATVSTSASDANSQNNSSTATTTVFAIADVGITKSASADTVTPGGTITYTIGVTNDGPSEAANVALNDPLPADVVFVSENQDSGPTFSCTTPMAFEPGTVKCTIASLAPGASATFTVTVLVGPTPASAAISNKATVSSSTPDYSEEPNNSATATTYVLTAADLSVTKDDSPDPVVAGGTITYTITVTNNGPGTVGHIVLTDDIPAGTTLSSITGPQSTSCNTPDPGSGGTIECTIPSIANGDAAVFIMKVNVLTGQDDGTTITNTASVDSSTNTDPNPGNDQATATTTVNASADLVVSNQDAPDPVPASSPLKYTIDVANNGPSGAHDVTFDDSLPAGTTFVSLSAPAGFNCSTPAVGAAGTVSCTGGTVDLGGVQFELVVKVSSGVVPGTVLSDTATVSASTPDPDPGHESSTATTTVSSAAADLAVSKTGPATASRGGDMTYTIELENKGPSDAANVTLTDTLPASTSFKSLDSDPGFTCTTGATVTCSASSLAGGAKATFKLGVHVDTNASPGSTISNTASASTTTTDGTGNNNSSTADSQVVSSADVSVTKSDSPDPVTAGSDLTYTISVANDGPSPATGVTLTDDLPAGTTFVSASAPSGFSCTTPAVGSGGTVSCTTSAMSSAASGDFTLVVHVAPDRPKGSTLSNTASVAHGESDPNTANDDATSTTTVATSADVSVTASDSPDPVSAGSDLTYTLGLANSGPSSATGVILTDDLPTGTTFVSLDAPAGFSCTTPAAGAGGTVTCAAASSLASGATAGFTLVVHVASDRPSGSTLSNTVSVSHGESDPGSANDSATSTTTVAASAASADLSTSVSDSPDPVVAGNSVAYHLHITDDGPSDATQPRLSVPIPTGTTLVGAAQVGGSAFHCTSDGTTVTCGAASLAAGGSAAIDMVVRTARSQRGTISVHPRASSSTADPVSSNDASSETTTIARPPTSVTIGRTVTKRRSGSILVAVACHGFRGDSCPVAVTVTFKSPHSDLAPITGRKTIAAGRRSIVYVIGSRSERRMIKSIRTLPVRVDVTNRNGSGATRDATIVGTR
jgi:uncharacterized repeat protein (TIGR01451 family)